MLLASLFSGLGMGPAVIQSQRERSTVAYHGLVVTALFQTALFLLLVLSADMIGGWLGDPDVVPVLRVMSLMLLIGGLGTIPDALLQKSLLFNRVSLVVIVPEVLHIAVSITMAALGFGVWSLVYSALARSVLTTVMLWWLCPERGWVKPRPWDWELVKSLVRFGWQSAGSGVIVFMYQTVDTLVVGRYVGTAALGFYSQAYNFTIRTVFGFSAVIGNVLFPSYAQIQDDKDRLSRAYLKSLRVTALATIPMAMGIFITADEMVRTLLGQKWVPMVPLLQILAFVGLVMPISSSTAAVFSSTGRPGYNLRSGLVVMAVLLIGIFVLLPQGAFGVATAVLVAHSAGFLFNLGQLRVVLPGVPLRVLPAVLPATVATAIMMAAVGLTSMFLTRLFGNPYGVMSLTVLVGVGFVVYGTVIFLTQGPLVREVLGLATGGMKRWGESSRQSAS